MVSRVERVHVDYLNGHLLGNSRRFESNRFEPHQLGTNAPVESSIPCSAAKGDLWLGSHAPPFPYPPPLRLLHRSDCSPWLLRVSDVRGVSCQRLSIDLRDAND
jgi:hypothetical protein